jgi:thiol-disulfide isomerase/thioredoxin
VDGEAAAGDVTLVVTFYGRPGCHLCDEAREALLSLAGELGELELREVDIEGDERLLSAYLERIPVVAVDGEIVSELRLDPHELRARLHTVQP